MVRIDNQDANDIIYDAHPVQQSVLDSIEYKNKKSRGFRKLESIDPALISICIKLDMTQTIESLAARLAINLRYDFNDVLKYLTDDRLQYIECIIEQQSYTYAYKDWTPGTNDKFYLKKKDAF